MGTLRVGGTLFFWAAELHVRSVYIIMFMSLIYQPLFIYIFLSIYAVVSTAVC